MARPVPPPALQASADLFKEAWLRIAALSQPWHPADLQYINDKIFFCDMLDRFQQNWPLCRFPRTEDAYPEDRRVEEAILTYAQCGRALAVLLPVARAALKG
jgi:citrate lyase beta subunit